MRSNQKRVSFVLIAALVGIVSFVVGSSGCDDTDQIGTAFDCDTVCDRYRDCFDQSYNVDACQDRCESRAANESFRNSVDACEDCIGRNSCLSMTFNCPSCDTIVP
jgi:hypothetical protein